MAGRTAHFARVQGSSCPKVWRAHACRAETTATSCYWRNYSRGRALEHTSIPSACRKFSLPIFQDVMRCRTLLFVGDSPSLQHWQSLVCGLPQEGAQYTMLWEQRFRESLCPFGAEHCYSEGGCVHFPSIPTQICFVRDAYLPGSPAVFHRLGPNAIVVFNCGRHRQTPKAVSMEAARIFAEVKSWRRSGGPIAVLAESPPQHFPGYVNGYWDLNRDRKYTSCSAIDLNLAAKADWRNAVPRIFAKKTRTPILRVWNVSAPQWRAHVTPPGRRVLQGADCSAWCLPGVPQAWTANLLALLTRTLSPITGNCSVRSKSTMETILQQQQHGRNHRKRKQNPNIVVVESVGTAPPAPPTGRLGCGGGGGGG
eukprot:GGOE01002983.1.p1 GENE.GGOE01002983.1~~GGOE01002983.1.p1  ORF type:complete len:382 (-),score=86.44 GGOE01002983.1:486-1589(-)